LTSINNQNRITLIIFLLALFAVIQVFITASNNFLSAGNIFGTYRGLSDYSSLRSGGEFLLGYRSASVLMLGYFSALGLISLLVLFWMSNSFIHRMIALPFLFLLATFIFVSGSRGPLVLVCVSSSAMALVAYPGQRRKSLLIITGILIFIVLTYLMLPKEITQRFQFAEVETSFSTRFNPSAWGLFVKGLDKPLWGWGTGSSPYLMFGGDSKMYPHNIFVELFCELGLIGLVIFCYFLYTAFKEFYFALRLSVPGSPLFYGLIWAFGLTIGMLIGAQLSGDINDASGVWLSVALMMKFSAMQEEQALISSDSTTSELAEVARIEDYNYFLSNR
jgi:O-antigen ligase